jgi:hypothetical protein
MNPKLLIGVIVVLVLLAVSPVLLNLLRGGPEAAPPAAMPQPMPQMPVLPPPPPSVTETPPPVADYPVTYQPPARTAAQYERQQSPTAMQPLTAETLVGTAWEVATPHGPVAIELGPNGQATANHPMVGAIPGQWSASGNKVTASASFMGQSMSMNATIDGSTLKVQGQNIRRLR